MIDKIFVYGTLQKGECNNEQLQICEAVFICRGAISGALRRFLDSDIPFLLASTEKITSGEIWKLPKPEEAIEILDAFEGGLYKRFPTVVQPIKKGMKEPIEAWAYFMAPWLQERLGIPDMPVSNAGIKEVMAEYVHNQGTRTPKDYDINKDCTVH